MYAVCTWLQVAAASGIWRLNCNGWV